MMMPKPHVPHPLTAVLYARVSSKEQEKEGFSIPAQLKLLRGYAEEHGFTVSQDYIDIETAKRAGRTGFTAMVEFFKKQRKTKAGADTRRILLVEKTDRLYRNLKDWVTLDDLDLEIHLVKENVILTHDSRSSEKFMHGIRVLMAKNYIDNLSDLDARLASGIELVGHHPAGDAPEGALSGVGGACGVGLGTMWRTLRSRAGGQRGASFLAVRMHP